MNVWRVGESNQSQYGEGIRKGSGWEEGWRPRTGFLEENQGQGREWGEGQVEGEAMAPMVEAGGNKVVSDISSLDVGKTAALGLRVRRDRTEPFLGGR